MRISSSSLRIRTGNIILSMMILMMPRSVPAEWQNCGTVVAGGSGYQSGTNAIADGQNGAVVVFPQSSGEVLPDGVYAQRITVEGEVAWQETGTYLGASAAGAVAASDGTGGSVVAWSFRGEGNWNWLYVQRVLGNGAIAPEWPDSALQFGPPVWYDGVKICPDGGGGAFIAHGRGSRVFRITGDGSIANGWPIGGVPLDSTGTAYSEGPWGVVSDGAGGAYVAATSSRNGLSGVLLQRFTADGEYATDWPAEGLEVGVWRPTTNGLGEIVPDGDGGVILAWWQYRGVEEPPSYEIFAQRIMPSGAVAKDWPAEGVRVLMPSPNMGGGLWSYTSLNIAGDGAGGATVVWVDMRDVETNAFDLYAQRVLYNGSIAWPEDGVPVCIAPGDQGNPVYFHPFAVLGDRSEGTYVTWLDGRPEDGPELRVYVTRIDGGGFIPPPWPPQGLPISPDWCQGEYELSPRIVPTGQHDAIVVWTGEDPNPGNYSDTYAQYVTADGQTVSVDGNEPAGGPKLLLTCASPIAATLRFDVVLPGAGNVSADLFDIAGRQIRSLVRNAACPGGRFTWETSPHQLASGVYLLAVRSGNWKASRRIVVIE